MYGDVRDNCGEARDISSALCSRSHHQNGIRAEWHSVIPYLSDWPTPYAERVVAFASRGTVWDAVCGHAVRTERDGGESRPAMTTTRRLAPPPAIGRHR